jgi:hypothetical protein
MSTRRIPTPTVSLDDLYGEEAADWMRLTPQQRWAETMRLATWFHALGGTGDPDPDPSSPFYDPTIRRARPVDGGAGLRVVRRGRI